MNRSNLFRSLMVAILACPAAAQPESKDAPAAPKQAEPAKQPVEAKQPEAGKPAVQTAAELQDAVRAKYAALKTYSDAGVVRSNLKTKESAVKDQRPFATAYERDGRFRWEFRGSRVPQGKPKERYVVWSKDQKMFESWWEITGEHKLHDSFDMAMAGPTGVSGGSANAIIPILRGTDEPWVLMIESPKDLGKETVNEKHCRKIGGATPQGDEVTMWIDSDLAIRKVFIVREVDPTKLKDANGVSLGGEKFTAETTIEFSPRFDLVLDDVRFEAPKWK